MKISLKPLRLIAVALIVSVFILMKWRDLQTPYFWDELGVFARGALRMKDTGTLGIFPHNLASEYSLGHPMMCFFVFASAFRVFGDSVFVGHLCALAIGCCTLFAAYFFGKSLVNQKTGIVFMLLLAIQPMFYALSGVISPEGLLTLFTMFAIWAIAKENWGVYGIAGALAMLTKESAIVIPATCICCVFIQSVRKRDFFTLKRWGTFLIAAIPIFVFVLFLILQKRQNGWYFFPLHVGYIRHDWHSIRGSLKVVFYEIFVNQGRWILGIPAMIILSVRLIVPSKNQFINKVTPAIIIFIFLSMVSAAVNFYLARYLLYVIPLVVFAGVYAWVSVLELIKQQAIQGVLLAGLTVAGCVISYTHMDQKMFRDMSDMSYKPFVQCQQECMAWCEQQPWAYTTINAGFPIFQGLDDPRNGYLKLNKKWPRTADSWTGNAKYGIFFHFEDKLDIGPRQFHVIKRFDKYNSHFSVLEFDDYKEP